MATRTDIIGKIRRQVGDFKEPVKYEKEYYDDAIDFGLQKLSFDLDADYSDVPLIPFKRVFLLLKLAIIQMCFVRAGDRTDSSETAGSGDGTVPDFASLTVPALTITREEKSETEQADSWLKIAQTLQDEYDGEIAHIGGESLAAEVTVGTMKRISLKSGGWRKRVLDEGPPARVLAASVDVDAVTLTWDKWFHETFCNYRVYRATDAGFSDAELIQVYADNHEDTHADLSLASGTYFYKVATLNMNSLSADSNVQEVTIV